MKGDIGHMTNVFLVLGNGLGPGDDSVGDVAVAAPADEGLPVFVQSAGVHLAADLDTFIQNHVSKVSEADATVFELEIIDSSCVKTIGLIHDLVLKCGH